MNREVFSCGRRVGILSVAGLLLLSAAQGGEKIHFSDSPEKVDVPKPTTRDDQISSRFGGSKTQGSDAGPPVSMESTPRPAATPLMSQKLEEYLDKKRNWMFVDPKDKDKFGSEQNLDPEETSLDPDKKPKTVQEKFYEQSNEKPMVHKKTKASEDSDSSDNGRDANRDRDRDEKSELEPNSLTPELSLGSLLRLADRSDAGMRALSDMSRATSLGSFAPNPSDTFHKADREREIKQHDADFAKIIAPRSTGSGFSASGDPANTQNDITRQAVNPFAPRTGFGSSGAAPSSDASPGFSTASSLPRHGGTESFASQLPSAPSFSSSSSFSGVPAASYQSERKPIFFEPPRRKF